MSIAERMYLFLYRTSMIWKTGLATSLSWEICVRLGFIRPTMAPMAAILCLQVTINDSIQRAYQRTAGTILGVIVTAFAIHFLGINFWSVGLVVMVSTTIGRWIKVSEQIVPQIGTTAMLVFVLQTQNHRYPLDRIEETVIGCLTAILVNMLLFPPNYSNDAIQSIKTYTDHLTNIFLHAAQWIQKGCEREEGEKLHEHTQKLLAQLHQTMEKYKKAIASLKFNPFTRNSRETLGKYNEELIHLRQGYAHISGMLRTFKEWAAIRELTEQERRQWFHHMQTIASYIKDWERKNEPQRKAALSLPEELEAQRFSFALYNDARQIMEDFQK